MWRFLRQLSQKSGTYQFPHIAGLLPGSVLTSTPFVRWTFRKQRGTTAESILPPFAKIFYRSHAQEVIEDHLCPTKYVYREGGNCTGHAAQDLAAWSCRISRILQTMQHRINEFPDNPDCRAVRLFTLDFSKASDSVKHELLARKLKNLQLNPYIINLYLIFLNGRKQRICCNNISSVWKCVNQGTTQGSVSGPYLFNTVNCRL